MDFLEQLKKQAREAKVQHERDQGEEEFRLAAFRSQAAVAMGRIHSYLRELVDNLNHLKPDITLSYHVPGYGELKGLKQGDYHLLVEEPATVAITMVSAGSARVKFPMESRAVVQRQWDYMAGQGLRFFFEEARGQESSKTYRGVFHLESRVPTRVAFSVDEAKQCVRLSVKNLDALGEHSYSLKPEQIDDELLDEVGKAVGRQPNRLKEVTGFQVPDALRRQLQDKLKREAEAKQKELGGAASVPAQPAGSPKKPKGLLGNLFGGGDKKR